MTEQEFVDQNLGSFWKWTLRYGGYVLFGIFVIGVFITLWVYPADQGWSPRNQAWTYWYPRIFVTTWLLGILILSIQAIALRKQYILRRKFFDNYLNPSKYRR